jgi:hypothetical protein
MTEAYIFQNSSIFFPYLLISFGTISLLTTVKDTGEKLVVIVLGLVVLVMYHQYVLKGSNEKNKIGQTFSKHAESIQDIEIVIPNVNMLHKKPKHMIYIYHNEPIMKIINDLSFIKTYDNAFFEQIVIIIEGYLKVYYGILDGKYEDKKYFGMMLDMRNEVLSLLQQLYLNVPIYVKTKRENAHGIIEKNTRKIQSITYHHLKIISRRCKLRCGVDLPYDPPYPTGIYNSNHLLFG